MENGWDVKMSVELISKDEKSFIVEEKLLTQSKVITDMLEESGDEKKVVNLLNVEAKILEKVIAYIKNHKDNKAAEIEKPLKGKLSESVSKWDYEFISVDNFTLIEIIMAANYLDIKDLLDLACAKVAESIKGRTPEQIREMFGIENDFTPEEEEKIREENKWVEA